MLSYIPVGSFNTLRISFVCSCLDLLTGSHQLLCLQQFQNRRRMDEKSVVGFERRSNTTQTNPTESKSVNEKQQRVGCRNQERLISKLCLGSIYQSHFGQRLKRTSMYTRAERKKRKAKGPEWEPRGWGKSNKRMMIDIENQTECKRHHRQRDHHLSRNVNEVKCASPLLSSPLWASAVNHEGSWWDAMADQLIGRHYC